MKPKFVVCANLRKISGALECEQSVFILQNRVLNYGLYCKGSTWQVCEIRATDT